MVLTKTILTKEGLDEVCLYLELNKLGKISNETLLKKTGIERDKEKKLMP